MNFREQLRACDLVGTLDASKFTSLDCDFCAAPVAVVLECFVGYLLDSRNRYVANVVCDFDNGHFQISKKPWEPPGRATSALVIAPSKN